MNRRTTCWAICWEAAVDRHPASKRRGAGQQQRRRGSSAVAQPSLPDLAQLAAAGTRAFDRVDRPGVLGVHGVSRLCHRAARPLEHGGMALSHPAMAPPMASTSRKWKLPCVLPWGPAAAAETSWLGRLCTRSSTTARASSFFPTASSLRSSRRSCCLCGACVCHGGLGREREARNLLWVLTRPLSRPAIYLANIPGASALVHSAQPGRLCGALSVRPSTGRLALAVYWPGVLGRPSPSPPSFI